MTFTIMQRTAAAGLDLELALNDFLRTGENRRYGYLGRLKYLDHDRERERPVYF